jgi:hypothetical protein
MTRVRFSAQKDGLGSVRGVTDNASAVLWNGSYGLLQWRVCALREVFSEMRYIFRRSTPSDPPPWKIVYQQTHRCCPDAG